MVWQVCGESGAVWRSGGGENWPTHPAPSSLPQDARQAIVPPAVAILNYMTKEKLYCNLRIPKLVFIIGFSLHIINIAGRNSEADMGGAGGSAFCAS